jgi:hypothetical protein
MHRFMVIWSGVSNEESSMTAPARTTESAWPVDVLALAGEKGIMAYLDPVAGMTQQIFPGRSVRVSLQADHEIAEERYVTVWVNVTGLSIDLVAEAEEHWYRNLRQICSRAYESLFYLGMEGN